MFSFPIGVSQSLWVAAFKGWIFALKKGVGGFAEGGRKGEERVRLKEWGVAYCNIC